LTVAPLPTDCKRLGASGPAAVQALR